MVTEKWTRAGRYAVVGGVAFLVDFGLLLLLSRFMPLLAANTIAFLCANGANFLMGHKWVFAGSAKSQSIFYGYGAVLAISLVGLVLNDTIVWLGAVPFDAGVIPSKIAATMLVWVWNYQARIIWVYR